MSALLVFLLALPAWCAPRPDRVPAFGKTDLSFPDGRSIQVDVASIPAQREHGLMFRKSLPKDYGMLFVFSFEDMSSFWMKNTFVSLDIVFIGKDKRITAIHERVKPSREKTPDSRVARVSGRAQYVLELPAGQAKARGLKPGRELGFSVKIPEN